MQTIVTVSPKGQITLPASARKALPYKKFLLSRQKQGFLLQPIEIKVVGEDDLQNFSALAEKSFDFWNTPEDDIYESFYSQK